MAINVSYLDKISVGGVDLSDQAVSLRLNLGQESREATTFGNTARVFRAGLRTLSVEAEFMANSSTGAADTTLRNLISITSTSGNALIVQRQAPDGASIVTSATNPQFSFTAIFEGDQMALDDSVGELPRISGRFVPLSGTISITTTASS